MRLLPVIVILSTCLCAHAELPYPLPPKAKYTASAEAITQAKTVMSANLGTDTTALARLFSQPILCGPGLWNALKGSPHFAMPPQATSTVRMPVGNDKFQELPMALLQSEDEAQFFRKALADLISSQGPLTIREPNEQEFQKYWAVIPFDEISGPLLVAEGKSATIFCQFEDGKVFWVDEVKRMRFEKSASAP